MNSVRSNNISLKYQKFTTLDSKDKGIIKLEFVTKTQFLCFYKNKPTQLEFLNIAVVLPGSSIKIGGKSVMLFMSFNWIYKQRLLLYISKHLVSVVIKRTVQVK